jgi:YNFM family putative membrane transporter
VHNTFQTEATQLAPEARGLSIAMFAIVLFGGQSLGVALAGWILDRWGGTPIFIGTAIGLLAVVLWFRMQLLRRNR